MFYKVSITIINNILSIHSSAHNYNIIVVKLKSKEKLFRKSSKGL